MRVVADYVSEKTQVVPISLRVHDLLAAANPMIQLGSLIPVDWDQILQSGGAFLNPEFLQKPLLYSEWKGTEGIKTSNPFATDPALGSPLPALTSVDSLRLPAAEKMGTVPVSPVIPERFNRESTDPRLLPSGMTRFPDGRNPKSFRTPLNWNALQSRYGKEDNDKIQKNQFDAPIFNKRKSQVHKTSSPKHLKRGKNRIFQES